MDPRPASDRKAELARRLEEARRHTLKLIEPLTDEQLNRVYDPILSPLIWDLGHIGNFEELWLVQRIGGREPLRGDLGELYDAIEQPRKIRGELPILRADEVRPYMEQVRERTLEVLGEIELDPDDGLLADGFVYEMLLAHEYQHNETMLQLLQMVEAYEPVEVDRAPAAETVTDGPEMVRVEGGIFEIGAAAAGLRLRQRAPPPPGRGRAFPDRPDARHQRRLHRLHRGDRRRAADVLGARRGGRLGPHRHGEDRRTVDPRPPGDPRLLARGRCLRPLGGQAAPDRAGVGGGRGRQRAASAPTSTSSPSAARRRAPTPTPPPDCGAVQMLGDVWEWTSSDFTAYPGFAAFPYPEYSEVFFGDTYKVLRGGAWATRRDVIRTSFRNWDLPERRQIFSGIRCASDESDRSARS